MITLRRCSPEIERELHDKEARIRELEAALRPFVDAFGSQDWYRRRHDVNVLSEMLCLPVPITPDDIERACKELAAPAPPDSEPAEGAGGGDGIPQCSCVTKTPDWRHHDASCNYRVYMEDSFPPQWKGEPTVRESTHGGYVWTCCDECGPDVKVDEDGLCIACGRNAVYFGKKHPDDTPPQRRDAGDILREKLSDPEAMQRVTERAAEGKRRTLWNSDPNNRTKLPEITPEAEQAIREKAQELIDNPPQSDDPAQQQDAMLERRDALEALVSVLPEIEFGRETHRKWRDYLRAYPEQIKENPDIGDADFHAQMVETYDARIGAIRKAQRALSRTSDEGTGCVVPEAVRRLPDKWLDAGDWYERKWREQEGRGCYHAQASTIRMLADELDRALAEQGGQRVPEAITEEYALSDDDPAKRIAYNRVHARFFAAGWNACRRAMLAAAPQPQEGESDE